MPLIAINNLWKTYTMGVETVHALRGATLTIEKGEYVLITIPDGLEYLGKVLLKDIDHALPGVFVSLTFAGVEVDTKKLDDLEGQEDG